MGVGLLYIDFFFFSFCPGVLLIFPSLHIVLFFFFTLRNSLSRFSLAFTFPYCFPNPSSRIIVGVKYCFRYNARNRQLRLNEDGEPINLENMPRQHRRRREKKLMTMDEVNEKFPMQKYKNWVASRAQEGLPTRGGVSSPQSRSGSLRDADGVIPELPPKERESTEERPATDATAAALQEKPQQPGHQPKESTSSTAAPELSRVSTEAQIPPTVTESDVVPKITRTSQDEDEDEDDEHINAALPPECMGTSGDTCAICIDTLEDDDDVRGLTCGHAFHAACLDPWLTSRRACCPLCKADYYTPKPRAAAAEASDGTNATAGVITIPAGHARHVNMPSRPQATWIGLRGHGRMVLQTRFGNNNQGDESRTDRPRSQPQQAATSRTPMDFLNRFRQRSDNSAVSPTTPPQHRPDTSDASTTPSRLAALRSAIPSLRFQRRRDTPAAEGPVASGAINNDVSPSNLEAGVRPTESR